MTDSKQVTGPPRSSSSLSDSGLKTRTSDLDDVTIPGELVVIKPGTIQIALPDPLAEPWRELAASPRYDRTASHPNTD